MLSSKERQANAIETEKNCGTVSPGLLGTCWICQQGHDMSPREFYHAVHESQTLFDEGGFTWSGCEMCGSSFGGDKYAAHGIAGDGCIYHLDVCVDCVMATANGEDYPNEGVQDENL